MRNGKRRTHIGVTLRHGWWAQSITGRLNLSPLIPICWTSRSSFLYLSLSVSLYHGSKICRQTFFNDIISIISRAMNPICIRAIQNHASHEAEGVELTRTLLLRAAWLHRDAPRVYIWMNIFVDDSLFRGDKYSPADWRGFWLRNGTSRGSADYIRVFALLSAPVLRS